MLAEQPGTHRRREVDGLATEVFQQEGHAGEGARRQTRCDRRTGDRLLHVDDGAEAVGGHGLGEGGVEQLGR